MEINDMVGNPFYFTHSERFQDVIPELFDAQGQTIYDEIRDGDLVFINSKAFIGKKILKPERFKSIITNIDSVDQYCFRNGIVDITNPNNSKEFNIIHLGYFKDEIQDTLDDCLSQNMKLCEVEEAIIDCLETILLDLNNHAFKRKE